MVVIKSKCAITLFNSFGIMVCKTRSAFFVACLPYLGSALLFNTCTDFSYFLPLNFQTLQAGQERRPYCKVHFDAALPIELDIALENKQTNKRTT